MGCLHANLQVEENNDQDERSYLCCVLLLHFFPFFNSDGYLKVQKKDQ